MNPDLPESFEEDNLLLVKGNKHSNWTSQLDPYAPFEVNEAILEDAYPEYPLRLPKEQKNRKGPQQSLNVYESRTSLCADLVVVVQPHKTLDKNARAVEKLGHPFEYKYGRIQITVPRDYIGIEAKVHLEFPNASLPEERRRRGRKHFDYAQIGDHWTFGRKSQSKQAGT